MKFNQLCCFAVCSLGLCVAIGCNNRPDPRQNPEFNEGALTNPGAVEMKPLGGNKKSK